MSKFSAAESNWTAPLAQISAADLDLAGGKGANLGELIRAGFPVPPGFVITTTAYAAFVTGGHLDDTIRRGLGEQPVVGEAIRAAFEREPVPAEMADEIRRAYAVLGPGPVAVRSSATAEDLPGAAFAGQQETYLNISGAEALLEAVRRCWASLWGDRAIAYRARLGLDQGSVKLAVVVQKMVAAETAGVLFTANPLSGAREELLIDANPGLGEAVVSGAVTPDHFVLRQRGSGWKITTRQAGRRELLIRARVGGGTEQIDHPDAAELAALPDAALHRLARLGAQIQAHFGRPQDIEWAWAGGQPWILQARPMTALPDALPRASLPQRLLASNFGEMLPTRPYPLDLDTWLPALSAAVEPLFTVLGFSWTLGQLFEIEDGVVVRFRPNLPRPSWRLLLGPARLLWLGLRYNPLHWQADPLLAEYQARARALEADDLTLLGWDDLLDRLPAIQAIPLVIAGEVRLHYFPRAAFAAARLRLLLGPLGQTGQFGALMWGAENKTLEANRGLEGLADRVRADPALAGTFAANDAQSLAAALAAQPAGQAFLADLRAFLAQYGHRETVISTALNPTWKDAPEVVLGIIKSFAAHPPQPPAGPPPWQAARDEMLRLPLLRFAPLRAAFLAALAGARTLLQIREDTHFYATLALPLFRRTLLEMGRRLVQAGVLDTAEDIFQLRLAELERMRGETLPPADAYAAELRAAVARRKEARARLEDTPMVDPRLFPQTAASAAGDALLRGMPGSPGVAQGPVRIVRDASEFDRLLAGEVLVAPYTNPSWTLLFQRAAAVIVDSGSAASHAAIVAREYGIPAVMSTVTGTRTLRDGEIVRVDGSQGLVFRAGNQEERKTHE